MNWADQARQATARIKGGNAALAIDALVAHPVLSAMALESTTGLSRDTAERLLVRLKGLGLIREVTGGKRFRLWTAVL